MSAKVIPIGSVTRSLTREERDLVKGLPGLAERIVRDVCGKFHNYHGNPKSSDLLQLAHLGIYQGAQTFKPTLGEFWQWAYYKGAWAVLDGLRQDRRQRKMLFAGLAAGCMYLATKRHCPDEIDPAATDDELIQGLVDIGQEHLVAELIGVTVAAEKPEGEEDLIEREAWAKAVQALGKEIARLREDQRALLTAYAHGRDLKSIAKCRGVSYWALLDEWHALLAVLRARLGWLGVKSFPAPVAGDWGS